MSSTEQTENVRGMFDFLKKQVEIAQTNNVAHATATSNAWRDAVTMVPQSAGSLDTLLLQLGNTAGPIVARVGGLQTTANALSTLQNMTLVFDSPTRQQLLKKAVTSLTNLNETLKKLPSVEGGQFGSGAAPASSSAASGAPRKHGDPVTFQPTSSSTAGLTGMALLNSPMPHIEKAKVVFDPANMRTGASANPEDAAGGLSRMIKPQNHMTFSSAESSASARLGVAGKCATCGAARPAGSNFCGACGKNSNIVFE